MNRLLVVAFALGVGCLILPTPASGQISPGPLSKAHQSLSGASQCVACHKAGAGRATFVCLDCHTEIANRLKEGRGLHSAFLKGADNTQSCVKCHSEHNGENFNMIRWATPLKQFDHSMTGYALEGKHAGLDCKRCHTPEHIHTAEREFIKVKDLSRTFLGLSRSCSSCHRDPHLGRRGQNCLQCHGMNSWKPTISLSKTAELTGFDHSKTRFPLTGAHLRTSCLQCHARNGGSPQFTGLAFRHCSDCHADPHHGSFAGTCESCHNTRSWKSFSMGALGRNFDHSKTKFPLLGKHLAVTCDRCHVGGDFKKPLTFGQCADCHRPDPHGGQFAKRPDGGKCESCHTVDGFVPSTFGIKEHAATRYPLEGLHAMVTCSKCHVRQGAATIFKIKFDSCFNCHRDAHQGQFAGEPHLNHCEQCHSVQGFHPSSFTLIRHSGTRFPLTGAHIATACADCHRLPEGAALGGAIPYRFENRTCTVCHRDPHGGQFMQLMSKAGSGRGPGSCDACHNTVAWDQIANFDHSGTGFPLTGSHRAVACAECHRPANPKVKLMNVDFHSAPKECESCHRDVHGGQFAK